MKIVPSEELKGALIKGEITFFVDPQTASAQSEIRDQGIGINSIQHKSSQIRAENFRM